MSLSTSEKLKVEVQGHTALVTIDNPGANTWDTTTRWATEGVIIVVPEPTTLLIWSLLVGLGIALMGRRRKR